MDKKAFKTPAKASATSRPRQKKVRLGNSSIQGHGLFAAEAIGSNMMVMGYFGEEINNRETDIREKMMKAKGLTSSYFFRLDEDTVIDATHCGNLARFINHSCQPNCFAIVEDSKIMIYSKRSIKIDEELTIDYKFDEEDEKIPCNCGSAKCRRSLN